MTQGKASEIDDGCSKNHVFLLTCLLSLTISIQGGSPSQTPLPVRPNTTLTIYTSHPPCPPGDPVGGSAPGFGHAYYSRRVAAANQNGSTDRDSFLPSLFRGGADSGNGGDLFVQQQQLIGGPLADLGGGGGKEERSRKSKLRWVDALNTWVPEKKVSITKFYSVSL